MVNNQRIESEDRLLDVSVKSDEETLRVHVPCSVDARAVLENTDERELPTTTIVEGRNEETCAALAEASGKVETGDKVQPVWEGGRKKEKSALCLLCEDFLFKFGHMNEDGSPSVFQLHHAAGHCGVPRRRMYDVINVLEAVGVVQRTAKLKYVFKGYAKLPEILKDIVETADIETEDKSVGHLTRKMICVLLKRGGMMATGEMAAKLIGPDVAPQRIKKERSQRQITIERRLYDIASILTSIGLLERVLADKRVPTIIWTYGWSPGDDHDPPVLAVAKMALEPAPTLEPLSEEQIEKSTRKRKATTLEKTSQKNPLDPQDVVGNSFIDEEKFSKMLHTNPNAIMHPFPAGQPAGALPGMQDSQDPLAALDPSALAALLAAQQNMQPSSAQQASSGMMTGEIPQEIVMQFQKYGLLYPYMMQYPPMQQASTDALSPTDIVFREDKSS